MTRNPLASATVLLACFGFAAGLTGCWIHVDKDANGQDKHVRIDTPFGGVHVDTDQTSAADLGLPVYPGSHVVKDHGDHDSADVQIGFGEWALHVRAVSYESSDKKEQIVAFYKKALQRYGDVLTCQDSEPVGTPTRTGQGLTCADHGQVRTSANAGGNHAMDHGFSLKAGSERHQHVVGFDSPANGETRFSLVDIDLPETGDNSASN